MNQRKYTLELLAEVGVAIRKPVITPLECNVNLTTTSERYSSAEELFHDVPKYQRMIDKLLYLTITRHVIAYVIRTLSHFC